MKCKTDPKLDCGYQVKIGSGKWSFLGSCQNCPIFKANNQSVLSKIKGGMYYMSIKKMRNMTTRRFDLEQLPDEIELQLLDYQFREDKNGRDCLYVTFVNRADENLTQKYTGWHMGAIVEALETLKLDDLSKLRGKWLLMTKEQFPPGHPRLIPKKVL